MLKGYVFGCTHTLCIKNEVYFGLEAAPLLNAPLLYEGSLQSHLNFMSDLQHIIVSFNDNQPSKYFEKK